MSSKLDVVVHAVPRLLLVFVMGASTIPFAVWLTFWGRGSTEHLTLVLLPALLIGPVMAIASVGLWLLALRPIQDTARNRFRWASALAAGLTAVAFVAAPSYLPGRLLNQGDIRAARSYCMMLVPRLEAYRQEQGAYPPDVRELMQDEWPVPRLLQTDEPFYRPVGAAYEFVFKDPSGWNSGHYYFAEDVPIRGHWQEW